MMNSRHLIFIILFFIINTQCKDHFIIVPGTWAKNELWHQAKGEFHSSLALIGQGRYSVSSFSWTGDYNHQVRTESGNRLAEEIQSFSASDHVHLITHSQGTNVAILAAEQLVRFNHGKSKSKQRKISTIYSFGAPVDMNRYTPNMEIIGFFYNFYSWGDYVQPLLGLYSRTYPTHSRRANIRITIDSKDPLHIQLHHHCVAMWLPKIHKKLAKKRVGNFNHFNAIAPATINFFTSGKAPQYILGKKQTMPNEIASLEQLRLLPADEQDLIYALLAHEEPDRVYALCKKKRWEKNLFLND